VICCLRIDWVRNKIIVFWCETNFASDCVFIRPLTTWILSLLSCGAVRRRCYDFYCCNHSFASFPVPYMISTRSPLTSPALVQTIRYPGTQNQLSRTFVFVESVARTNRIVQPLIQLYFHLKTQSFLNGGV
jgi:hypothetical protein